MLKRIFDIFFSVLGLLILFPFLIIIAAMVTLNSRGGAFYFQSRVGKDGNEFKLIKFRTMKIDADKSGLLTIGGRDSRITPVGYILRKYKLDELPQLLNVLLGDMSIVGPRPEVRKYVDLYTTEQRKVLEVKPGITDYASLEFFDENELLSKSDEPEKTYILEILPEKLRLNQKYIRDKSLSTDLKIILGTLKRIFR